MEDIAKSGITTKLRGLIRFAVHHGLTEEEDAPFVLNMLLDMFHMDAPDETEAESAGKVPETATKLLAELCDAAVSLDLIEDFTSSRNCFAARIMGCVTPSPKDIRNTFFSSFPAQPEKATDEFYRICKACNYIQTDAIRQNILFFADTDCGRLEITINLSKPEKDPREIARLVNTKSVGYPKCMLCVENSGYAGRADYPARQNHRMIPVSLCGKPWYFQYSPYSYYNEHCIVFNREHIPMKIDRGTFERLFDFIRQFPHYFLGSNADLPIVGGSILNHDHFQGGRHVFPLDLAPVRRRFKPRIPGVSAGILEWPMSTIILEGEDPGAITDESVRILENWRDYNDAEHDIFSVTDGTRHNTITPILKKHDGIYSMRLVLRNNRTSAEHPLGIFHPHHDLHHIKKENIGLIEVMGLFILPGRLKNECRQMIPVITGEIPPGSVDESDPLYKHIPWLIDIIKRNGTSGTEVDAAELLRNELGNVCAQVLKDAGVFKTDESGREAFVRFMSSCGYVSC